MFSTNPFHQFASDNSFLDYEKDGDYPFVTGDGCFEGFSGCTPAMVVEEEFATCKQDFFEDDYHLNLNNNHQHLMESDVKRKKTVVAKKDNHSKIHTAQGPRDRRVRLSIEVARKFFSLQDLLGFDKASTTLDWLFNKSKFEIEKLVKGKKHSSSSSTVTDQQSDDIHQVDNFLETLMGSGSAEQEDKRQKKKSSAEEPNKCCMEGKKKKTTRKYTAGFPANQSRAEARARARERTQEKLRNRMLDDDIDTKKLAVVASGGDDPASLTSIQPSFWSSTAIDQSENNNYYYNERIAELIMAQKISMPSSMLYSSSTFTGSLPDFTVVDHEQQGDSGSI